MASLQWADSSALGCEELAKSSLVKKHPSTAAATKSSLGSAVTSAFVVIAASTSTSATIASIEDCCTCSWYPEHGAIAYMG